MTAAWIVAATSVATYESLDQTVAAWEITSLKPNRVRLLSAAGFAVIFGVMTIAIHHHADTRDALASTPAKQVPEALFRVQLAELTAIEALIGGKDEYHLRREFQLSAILEYNVMDAIGLLRPDRETADQKAEVDRFFAGGNAQVDLRYVSVHRAPNGTITIFPLAGKIGAIHVSKRYVDRKALLSYFESSATIPAAVRDSLRQIDQTLDKDTRLMFDVLNDKYAEDPNNLYLNFDSSTGYFDALGNAYVDRLIPLKPASDKVIEAIRAYLKTD